jgi:hypothetical protein
MSDVYDIKPGEWPAFPESGRSGSISGLTKREYFAGLAMQGICANPSDGNFTDREHAMETAVAVADTLLAALEKKSESTPESKL